MVNGTDQKLRLLSIFCEKSLQTVHTLFIAGGEGKTTIERRPRKNLQKINILFTFFTAKNGQRPLTKNCDYFEYSAQEYPLSQG
jgi:hypothetical protein